MTESQKQISEVCKNLEKFLIEKNKRYGDSALNPLNIFSKLEAEDGICVRLDDKLKRVQNNSDNMRKNDLIDIVGYLLLYCVKKEWLSFDEFID